MTQTKWKMNLRMFDVTRVADVIVPDVFTPYVINRSTQLSTLWSSGIVSADLKLAGLVEGGGTTFQMPFWNDLQDGDGSETLSDQRALGVDKIGTGKDQARLQGRGKAWGTNDLAGLLAGSDPAKAIGELVASWWARDSQRILLATLKGIFASPSMSDLVMNVATEDGAQKTASNMIGNELILAAKQLLGDAKEKLTAIMMHSQVETRLEALGLITAQPLDNQGGVVKRFLGLTVIIDDSITVEAGAVSGFKYTSYLFGAGAIGYSEGKPKVATETTRDALKGEEILVNRRIFILHPRGIKWNEAQVSDHQFPTNADLATGANWSRVFDLKNIRIVKLVTNG